jgi:hypothetical protein
MDDDALMVRQVGELIVARKRDEASELLRSIPREDRAPLPVRQAVTATRGKKRRGSPSIARKFAVHEHYGWRCQYCGRRVVIAFVIELVGRFCPDVKPWFPNHHMPKKDTHPAAARLYPNADHIQALAFGGHPTAASNLICSCTQCNERKGSRGAWQRIVPAPEPWNGCVPLFAPLYRLARDEGAELTADPTQWLAAAQQAYPDWQ